MLQIQNKHTLTLVPGVSGSGKTTFALRYLINAPLDFRFIFDLGGDYSERMQLEPARDAYGLDKQLCQGWVLFDPEWLYPGRPQEAFEFFCDWVFCISERVPGRKCLVVDEAYRYQSSNGIPPDFLKCIFDGRKRGLEVLVNVVAPNKLNSAIQDGWTECICFRLQRGKALEICADWGFDPEQVAALPDLHFISRTNAGAELRGRIKV
jgi:hypothetical protein